MPRWLSAVGHRPEPPFSRGIARNMPTIGPRRGENGGAFREPLPTSDRIERRRGVRPRLLQLRHAKGKRAFEYDPLAPPPSGCSWRRELPRSISEPPRTRSQLRVRDRLIRPGPGFVSREQVVLPCSELCEPRSPRSRGTISR